MKVMVTGGCGFLGSYVCERFIKMGWQVVAYDNMTKFEYKRTGYNVELVRDYNRRYLEGIGVEIVEGDIRNSRMVCKTAQRCNLITHCAAQPAMTIAIEYPKLDFDINVGGVLSVLEACKKWDIPMVNCSTIHVYGNEGINKTLTQGDTRFLRLDGPIGEHSPLLSGVVSPLHASKQTAEIYVKAYADTYGVKAATFRLTGIYGPRQFGGEDHGWVANFAIRTLKEQPIKIFGSDKQVRDILYVKDAARAFWEWYDSGCEPGAYNIGGGNETSISIQELLDMLEMKTGKRSAVQLLPKRHGDLWWFISNYEKAEQSFGWKPRFLPEYGVGELLKWIEQNGGLFDEK